jgi:hypothetical protein
VDHQGELLVGDLSQTAAARQRDLGLAPLGQLGGVGAGAGVQQGQPRHPLGGLADDLDTDVAAHRQPGQGEPWRGVGQDAAGDGGHGVVAGGGGDRHRAVPPQDRELLGEQPWGAQQAGDQHDRERLGHRCASLPGTSNFGVGCRDDQQQR